MGENMKKHLITKSIREGGQMESCYSCGKTEAEFVLDDRNLCSKCYKQEKLYATPMI